VCRKKFIPKRDNSQYCSKECEKQHEENDLEERKGRYTEEEEELILTTLKNGITTEKLQELSEKLERPISSIKAKYKYMKKTGVAP
jgi:predicted transcriptional regulator